MRTEDIVNKVFPRSFMGYDIEQVDLFLDEVIECLERYEAEKKEMLTAMEYLLGKLEKGQKLPLSEMRKAIDSGKPAKKRALPPECAKEAPQDEPRREKPVLTTTETGKHGREEKKSAARSVARQASSPAPKQARAPKVQRVVKSGAEKEEPLSASSTAPEAREDWFDELLVNLCERERQGHTPAKPETAPGAPAKEAAFAPAQETQAAREPAFRPQTEQRQKQFETEKTGSFNEPPRQATTDAAVEVPLKQPGRPDEIDKQTPATPEQPSHPDEPDRTYQPAPEQPSQPDETESKIPTTPEQDSGESESH
ncbi:MAG: DivIVA domain-containing protein [Clostridiaceae bacterium]